MIFLKIKVFSNILIRKLRFNFICFMIDAINVIRFISWNNIYWVYFWWTRRQQEQQRNVYIKKLTFQDHLYNHIKLDPYFLKLTIILEFVKIGSFSFQSILERYQNIFWSTRYEQRWSSYLSRSLIYGYPIFMWTRCSYWALFKQQL